MELWEQVLSGVATIALLFTSGFAIINPRVGQARARAHGLGWVWRAGVLFAVSALLLSVLLRSLTAASEPSSLGWLPLSSVADRAALVALLAGLLTIGRDLRSLERSGQRIRGWAGLLLLAIVSGISAGDWPLERADAPVLLLCTLVAASLGLWAVETALDTRAPGRNANRLAAAVAFAALTLNVIVLGGVNWRVWGTPGGSAVTSHSSYGAFLGLLAVWLISAAGMVLAQNAVRFSRALELLATILLVGIALSVRWALPFN